LSAVDDQLATPSAPIAYFAELLFGDGTQRLTTWNHDLVWGGFTWKGLGAVVAISKIISAERPQYPALDLTLGVSAEAFAAARGNVGNYRGRDANLYRYVLSDSFTSLGAPDLLWAGEMSQVRVDTGDGKSGSITMRCEQRGRSQRSSSSLRLVSAQHEARFPGDTAFRRKEALIAKPQTWLSKTFQQL
jgi:hypothetical protein